MSNWNLEGKQVEGNYLEKFKVSGTVDSSRVKYGGKVCHTVKLDSSIMVYGRVADVVLLEDSEITRIFSSLNVLI